VERRALPDSRRRPGAIDAARAVRGLRGGLDDLVAAALGILAVPAVLSDLAHGLSPAGGYDYAAARDSLYDGSVAGLFSGLEVTLSLTGAGLLAVLAFRRAAAGRARPWLLGAGLAAGAVALGTAKFPTDSGDDWGRTLFETGVWMLHLLGGAIWIGGLAGLLLLALPGTVAEAKRGAFWAVAIRRFSAVAMSSVAAIALSGLFLYWEHVDGPGQLFTTMYGRTLGVKVLIFGTLLLLGVTVLFVAPFLHGSARNQAFQANAAAQATSATAKLPKIPAKQVTASTWAWGTPETVVVVAVMLAGYRVTGRLARSRTSAVTRAATLGPDDLVGA
jgi:copper transport protein